MSKKISDTPPLTDDLVRKAVTAAQARVDDERELLKKSEERLRNAEHELALLIRLGRLRGIPEMSECNVVLPSRDEGHGKVALYEDGSSVVERSVQTGRGALIQVVADVLREYGKPMPIRLLMAEVVSRGAQIPGRGEQANLISVITRAPDIVRLQRGVYGLREWGLDGMVQVPARRTTRRRKAAR